MFQYIKGTYVNLAEGYIVVENNGIGYKVHVSSTTVNQLPPLENNIFLYLFQVVREDSITLFGFLKEEELELFKSLISVSGIGPRVALSILSSISPEELFHAIINQKVDSLTKLKGIGKKSAQRIILELKDKLPKHINISERGEADISSLSEAREALLSLGYSLGEIDIALTEAQKDGVSGQEKLIRYTLKYLAERGF
mgnify:CR=1 FL=1